MAVPKAAVNENDLLPARKNKVWFSRKPLLVKTVPVSHPMDKPSHQHLGLGIAALDAPHIFRAFGGA